MRGAHLTAAAFLGLAAGPSAAAADALPLTSDRLTTVTTCTLTSNPASAQLSTEAYVASAAPTINNAGSPTLLVRSSTSFGSARAYIQFSVGRCLTSIPATAVVRSAKLRLLATGLPVACRTYDVFAVGSAWNETSVTWSNQPAGTGINQPPSAQRTSSLTAGSSGCPNSTLNAYLSWDVTADAARIVAGGANNGWVLRDDSEGASTAALLSLTSRTEATSGRAPQLVISYSVG